MRSVITNSCTICWNVFHPPHLSFATLLSWNIWFLKFCSLYTCGCQCRCAACRGRLTIYHTNPSDTIFVWFMSRSSQWPHCFFSVIREQHRQTQFFCCCCCLLLNGTAQIDFPIASNTYRLLAFARIYVYVGYDTHIVYFIMCAVWIRSGLDVIRPITRRSST